MSTPRHSFDAHGLSTEHGLTTSVNRCGQHGSPALLQIFCRNTEARSSFRPLQHQPQLLRSAQMSSTSHRYIGRCALEISARLDGRTHAHISDKPAFCRPPRSVLKIPGLDQKAPRVHGLPVSQSTLEP